MVLEDAGAILAHAGTLPTKTVHVPAWGGDVLVRGMTVAEFELNQAKLGKDDGKATAALVARCVVKADGVSRVFRDEHIDLISQLGFAEVNKIGLAISELSGLTPEAAEELAGNSSAAPSGEPSSESPETSDAPSPSLESA